MVSAPHPLAECLIERLQSLPESSILDFASGSGRNGDALGRAGFAVVALDDRVAASESPFAGMTQRFSAALSTHGLLHGTPAAIAARLRRIAGQLADGGLLYATFGSVRDSRFGRGRRLDASTYAPIDGDERGVAHAYFDDEQLRALLEPHYEVESLAERCVDDVAGAWAHRERALAGAVHWFAVAHKR
jgi:hypothetical protein